jgi:NifU-like protein
MTFYPPKISEKLNAARNAGRAFEATSAGTNATFVCGAVLRFTLQIDRETKEVRQAKFKTNGCGYAVASAQVLAEKIVGKFLTELHGSDKSLLRREIESELEAFDPHRKHCLEPAVEALHEAFADFRHVQIEEWTGEKALICTCFGISEATIEQTIESESLQTVEEVTASCAAGGGCGSCQPLIEDILETYWRERM